MNIDEVVKELLKNQEKFMETKQNKIKDLADQIEPFAWTDYDMKFHLEQHMSMEEMRKLDECARANLAGQKVMINALKAGLNNAKNRIHKDDS